MFPGRGHLPVCAFGVGCSPAVPSTKDVRADLENRISAEADLYIAAYAVLSSIGQLTAKDLNLNVQTYDPAAYYNLVKRAPVPISPQGKKLDKVLRALGKQ